MATSIVETITPQKAQEYLAKSGGNRNISKPVVTSYATTMREGKWILNGEPIVFDVDGVLLNGHHRLHAIIQSNVPIQTFVTRGVEHGAFTTFDCGRHRTLGQLIGMNGIKHYNSVASVVNVVFRLQNGLAVSDSGLAHSSKHTNSKMIDYFNNDRELFIEAGEFGALARNKASFIDGSIVGGTYYWLIRKCGYEKEIVESFFNDLCKIGTSESHTIDLLRTRLINDKMSTIRKTSKNVHFALLIKTWNYYITNENVKCLRFNPEKEEYPKFLKCDEVEKEA
jgi:hypothetical protein